MRSIELSYLSENRLVMAAACQFLRMTGFYVHETRINSDKYICDYKYVFKEYVCSPKMAIKNVLDNLLENKRITAEEYKELTALLDLLSDDLLYKMYDYDNNSIYGNSSLFENGLTDLNNLITNLESFLVKEKVDFTSRHVRLLYFDLYIKIMINNLSMLTQEGYSYYNVKGFDKVFSMINHTCKKEGYEDLPIKYLQMKLLVFSNGQVHYKKASDYEFSPLMRLIADGHFKTMYDCYGARTRKNEDRISSQKWINSFKDIAKKYESSLYPNQFDIFPFVQIGMCYDEIFFESFGSDLSSLKKAVDSYIYTIKNSPKEMTLNDMYGVVISFKRMIHLRNACVCNNPNSFRYSSIIDKPFLEMSKYINVLENIQNQPILNILSDNLKNDIKEAISKLRLE